MATMILTFHSDNGRSITLGDPPYLLTTAAGLHGLTNTVYDYAQPQQDGTVYAGSRLEPREISLGVQIMTDVVANRIKMLEAIDPKSLGTLVIQRGGFVRRIECVVTQAPTFTPARGDTCTFQLRAPNPYWRAEAEDRKDVASWDAIFKWELIIPIETGVVFGQRTEEQVVNVYNDGAADIGARIRFIANGTLKNPALVRVDTFEKIKLNLDMSAGDVVEVQTTYGKQYVRLTRSGGTVENAFWAWDVDNTFLQLKRGDNLYRFEADSGADRLDVTLYYDVAYSGV